MDRGPVQTSAVYLLGCTAQSFEAVPPPSPPSPRVPVARAALCEVLDLDGGNTADMAAALSLPATAPDSPALVAMDDNDSDDSDDGEYVDDTTGSEPPPPPLDALTRLNGRDSTATTEARLAGAVHVLSTEAAALQAVAALYKASPAARAGFDQAVAAVVQTQQQGPGLGGPGKVVVIGVGKSGHIGRKLAATLNSLAVPSSFVHPTEALHGDLGHIGPRDVLLFISYSGTTHELVRLLPHVDARLPLILLTAHADAVADHTDDTRTGELVCHRRAQPGAGPTILLPAPIPIEEHVAFGVAAPTASTTTALAVGDALAIVASTELHATPASVFRRNHPGGAIGEAAAARKNTTLRARVVPWPALPVVTVAVASASTTCTVLVHTAFAAAHGWVRVVDAARSRDAVAPPSRIRALQPADLAQPIYAVPGLLVDRTALVPVSADATMQQVAIEAAATDAGPSAIVAAMDGDTVVGVLELEELRSV